MNKQKSANRRRARKPVKDPWASFMVDQLSAERQQPKAAGPARRRTTTKSVNERGRPINEGHHFSKLRDEHIEAILAWREEGLSYGEIARRFAGTLTVSKVHIGLICRGLRRRQLPAVT